VAGPQPAGKMYHHQPGAGAPDAQFNGNLWGAMGILGPMG